MPPRLRGRRFVALVVLLLVLYYLHTRPTDPASLGPRQREREKEPTDLLEASIVDDAESPESPIRHEHSHQVTREPTSAFTASVRSLCSHWMKIFFDNRPRPSAPFYLTGAAQGVSIGDNDYGPRKPTRNYLQISEADIESFRASHAAVLDSLQAKEVAGDMFTGRGVVVVGGGEYYGPAIISLRMLRRTGCTLPVEVFVADASEYEPSLCDDYLPRYGARCVVLTHFIEDVDVPGFQVTRFQLKSFAILFSSFADVLYLDSDSIPLVDPATEFFSAEPYKSSGLVVWPDFWIATESPHFYTIVGLPFPSNLPKSSSETGQLLINKRTHLKTLLLAIYYNTFGPELFYPLLSQGVMGQGDKETFMAAALIVDEPYYRVKTNVASVGRHVSGVYRGTSMVQHHPGDDLLYAGTGTQESSTDGEEDNGMVRPAFLHSNTPKMNAGHLVDEGDLLDVDKRLRLWGSPEGQQKRFGYDVEKVTWKLLVETGCELEHVMEEWKHRKRLCRRLKEHWNAVFS